MTKTSDKTGAVADVTAYAIPEGLLSPRFAFRPGQPVGEADKEVARELWRKGRDGTCEWLESVHTALILPSSDGYTVQFPGIGDGRTRRFSGAEYGSMQAALYAARDWRDSQAAGLDECVSFPRGERIQWSDGELDAITERAAWLEQAVIVGWLPNPGYQLLHYVRMAIVQVLPWTRWRKMWQSRNIPYDIVARLPAKRKEAITRMKAFLKQAKKVPGLDTVGAHMPAEVQPVPEPIAGTPKQPEPKPEAVTPSPMITLDAPPLSGNGAELGLVERFILMAVEARVGPFVQETIKLVNGMNARLASVEQQLGAFLDRTANGMTPASPGVAASAVINLSDETAQQVLAQVGEFKIMQDMLHEELQAVRRLSGNIEDGRDGVDTRLRELEATVFRLAKGPNASAPVGQPAHTGPQRPKVVPVIGIMGPLPDQFRQICERVGDAAELVHLDNKNSSNPVTVPDRVEWAINNRFGTHAQEIGLKAALGADRVTYLAAGGVSSMVRAVLEIVERVNKAGGTAK